MVTSIFTDPFAFPLSASLAFLFFLCSLKQTHGFQGTNSNDDYQHTHHILQVNSLQLSAICMTSSTQVLHKRSSLQVVHKHGPCSELHQDKAKKPPTRVETLFQDEARVRYIRSRLAKNSVSRDAKKSDGAANLPAKYATGDYIVTVGLGTPEKQLSLIFDTGSQLTWTQCEPCLGECYQQKEAIFDPSKSSTYSNVSCNSALCDAVVSATGNEPNCLSSTCVYVVQYGDSSFSVGFFAKERLTLTSTDVFDNFLFGCGQTNQDVFDGAAGLLGLGRDNLSFPSQTAGKYNKIFSYCLPSSPSSTGFLSLGKGKANFKSVKFTPLSTDFQETSFYGLDISGISVGGKKLSIAASVFATAGAIIDSVTVITRLPPTAYAALRSAFRKGMSQYPLAAEQDPILDTCYDFSNYKSVLVPKISFFFHGKVEVTIPLAGTLDSDRVSQVCLAFAANDADDDVAIFGNTQQKALLVVYDGAGRRVGFSSRGCN